MCIISLYAVALRFFKLELRSNSNYRDPTSKEKVLFMHISPYFWWFRMDSRVWANVNNHST